jgi:signal transduction histidine kinase
MYSDETRIYASILISGLLLATIIIFFILSIIKHQKRKIRSSNEMMMAEVAILEKERRRIAFDLHDDLGALLSSIKINLQNLNTIDKEDEKIIYKAELHIDNAMEKIREISRNLMPQILHDKGLLTALEVYSEMLDKKNSVHIQYQCCISELPIEKEKEIHIYRAVQEIMNNALKHAKAGTIDLKIDMKKNNLLICIQDDGIGFDQALVVKNNKGLGLHNVLCRVDLLRGTVYLTTSPGTGTHYLIEIPL